MREEIYSSIRVLLQNDETVSAEQRECILQACRHTRTSKKNIDLCSPVEAAVILGCHVKTLYRYAARGVLHPVRYSSRKVRFDRKEVEDFSVKGLADSSKTSLS